MRDDRAAALAHAVRLRAGHVQPGSNCTIGEHLMREQHALSANACEKNFAIHIRQTKSQTALWAVILGSEESRWQLMRRFAPLSVTEQH